MPRATPVNSVYGIAGEELTLNPAGFPTEIASLNASGDKVRDVDDVIRYVRTLDDHNRVIALERIGLLGTAITDNNGFFETRSSYDNLNRPVERNNYNSSGNLLANDNGIATVRTLYTAYPDWDQMTEATLMFPDSPLKTKKAAFTRSSAPPISAAFLSVKPTLTMREQLARTMKPAFMNDATDTTITRVLGNQLSEAYSGMDGNPTNQKPFDYAEVTYKYDDKNRVIEKSYFGDDGTPQVVASIGAAIIRQEYDSQGNLVHRQFFDGLGHPSPHVDYGAPAIRIKVDGDTTYISLRNADDQPMKNPIHGYYAFSYKTATDKPLTRTRNLYFDRYGQKLSLTSRASRSSILIFMR